MFYSEGLVDFALEKSFIPELSFLTATTTVHHGSTIRFFFSSFQLFKICSIFFFFQHFKICTIFFPSIFSKIVQYFFLICRRLSANPRPKFLHLLLLTNHSNFYSLFLFFLPFFSFF